MALAVAFDPSNNLTCLAVMTAYEYDASFFARSMCSHRVQMQLFAWTRTGKVVCIFPRFNHIRHLLPRRVTLLYVGSGRSVALLPVETNLWGGLSFLYFLPLMR